MAASAVRKIDVEVELKTPADKYWQGLKEAKTLFPKAFPNRYKSIEAVEGDGQSAGSVRRITLTQGLGIVSFATERIESVDDTTMTFCYSVVDGDIMQYYKSYKGRMEVSSKGGGGSLLKWNVEYEKAADDAPDPIAIRDFAVQNFKELDAYLLAA